MSYSYLHTFKQGPVEVCWGQVEFLQEQELELQCLLEARHQHITSVWFFFWHIYSAKFMFGC